MKRNAADNLVPGLSFGYGYDGMGNRLTSSSGTGTGVATRAYTPNALNQYSGITHNGKLNVLTRSSSTVTADSAQATQNGVDQEGNLGNLYGVRQTAIDYATNGKLVTTNLKRSGTAAGSVQTWVPPANVTPAYDLDGNLLGDGRWVYTWDGENRLVSMTTTDAAKDFGGAPDVTLKFAYDWMGRRIGRTVETGSGSNPSAVHLSFAYDHWNPVGEWTRTEFKSTEPLTLLRTHLWGPDIGSSGKAGFGAPPNYQAAGGVGGLIASTHHFSPKEHFFPSYDANGNIIAWTARTGSGAVQVAQRMDYDPFGNAAMVEKLGTTALLAKLPAFGFSTKYQDGESGLYYYGHRYYDPVTGRWPSRDPIEEKGGINLYGFIGNNSINTIDKLGMDPWSSDTTVLYKQRGGIDSGDIDSYNSALFRDKEVARVRLTIMPECDKEEGLLGGGWELASSLDGGINATYENVTELNGMKGRYPGLNRSETHNISLFVSFDDRIDGAIEGAVQGAIVGGVTGGIATLPSGGAGALPGAGVGAVQGAVSGALWGSERTAAIEKIITVECVCQTEGEHAGRYIARVKRKIIRKKGAGSYYWKTTDY